MSIQIRFQYIGGGNDSSFILDPSYLSHIAKIPQALWSGWVQVLVRPTTYQQCARMLLVVVYGEFSLRNPLSFKIWPLWASWYIPECHWWEGPITLISRYPTPDINQWMKNNITGDGFASLLISIMTQFMPIQHSLLHKCKERYFNVCLNYYYEPTKKIKKTSSDWYRWLSEFIHSNYWEYRNIFNCYVILCLETNEYTTI